jgi:hypothetical protein
LNISDVIKGLLPAGTASRFFAVLNDKAVVGTAATATTWTSCPAWPPDVFAVVATIIDQSGCYTYSGPQPGLIPAHVAYLTDVDLLASLWTNLSSVPTDIENLWYDLYQAHGSVVLGEICDSPAVCSVLFKLFAIADEACRSMGWAKPGNATPATAPTATASLGVKDVTFADFARMSLALAGEANPSTMVLPYTPHSICSLVPTDTAIVLPKSMTATVGCTVRSLSHHLALLPGHTKVLPAWRMVDRDYPVGDDHEEPMRLLVVPFPFNVPEDSFTLAREPNVLVGDLTTAGYFGLEQKWLEEVTADLFVEQLLDPMLKKAHSTARGKKIHGILMPECALSEPLAKDIADRLSDLDIEFFITGALRKESHSLKNVALTYIFTSKGVDKVAGTDKGVIHGFQSKHHRWRLDEAQVKQYALNFPDDAKNRGSMRATRWWEDIDVSKRTLPFYAVRPDMALSVLICEDLARSDPAMEVIRAVGPNLVVALLMDGPQLSVRWPARYATVLADDPGSSVLSITCAGMVDRSNWPQSRPVRSIGLWRDSGGTTQELNLPEGAHGMLLRLKTSNTTQHTLDGRSDGNMTKKLTLSTLVPIVLDQTPDWL